MKKIVYLIATAFVVFSLQSCATQQYYANAVHSWYGANQNYVYRVWGYPDKIRKLPNGHKVLMYRDIEKGRTPVYTTPGTRTVVRERGRKRVIETGPTVSGGEEYTNKCITGFEINRKGRVVNASFRGNNCIATQQFMQQHIYRG